MFSYGRLLSFGFRMTLQHLQDNFTSLQNLQRPALYIQRNNFSLAKIFQSGVNQKQPLENTSSEESPKQQLERITGKLQLSFTCKKCSTRNFNKIISKHAYTKGVVIVRCEGCKNNHLIADNLGWFGGNESRNIEVIMKKKGESVRRIRDDHQGYFEVIAKEEALRIESLLKQQETEENVKPVEELEKVVKAKYEKVGKIHNS